MFKNFYLISFVCYLITAVAINTTTAATNNRVATPTQASLVIDRNSGKVLHAQNAKQKIYPASLTKVMTVYMIFEALDAGKIKLNHKFHVSKYATQALPSKLHLKLGDKITVQDAIHALTIKSANDVARVVAENLGRSEPEFARLMNAKAKQLGMHNTHFTNASGWHDPKQHTTAVDLAKLSLAIKDHFPNYYHFFGKTSFQYQGRTITGHNRVTATYPGAEGLKTGYHVPAGCNLITTATRGNKSLVAVVTGRPSAAVRDNYMVALLDQHFGVSSARVKGSKSKQKPINATKKRFNTILSKR